MRKSGGSQTNTFFSIALHSDDVRRAGQVGVDSVVVATLQKLDSVGLDQIDTAMFLGDAPGPDIGAEIFQGFGLTDAVEGVAQNGLNQIQQSLCGTAVRLNPVL